MEGWASDLNAKDLVGKWQALVAGVSGTHVRIRLVATGMVASDLVEAHPGSRLACIEISRRQTHLGLVVDHFALAEGLPSSAIDDLMGAWAAKYGIEASSAGAPFALRLPLPLSQVSTPGIVEMHQVELTGASPAGHVLEGGLCDLWVDCRDPSAAETLAAQLRGGLPPELGATVAVGDPSIADLECWAALRLASDVGRPA